MEIVLEIFIEIVLEIFLEGYVAVMTALLPKKVFSVKTYIVLKIMCAVVSVICLASLFIGFLCMTDSDPQEKLIGKYIFFIALAVTIIQIAIGVIGKIKSK